MAVIVTTDIIDKNMELRIDNRSILGGSILKLGFVLCKMFGTTISLSLVSHDQI